MHQLPNNNDENYYQQIVNLANVAIVKFTPDFKLTDFTGNSEAIFGFKKDEIIGKSLFGTIVPNRESTGRDLKELMQSIINDINAFKYNINENITKDGEKIWMQWYNSLIVDSDNNLSEILSIGIDITDRKNMEVTLKESEERFKTLSNLTFEGILIHDKGKILDCNLSFESQIGYARDELIGKNFLEKLITPESREKVSQMMISDYAQYEAEAIHKNGSIIPISIYSRRSRINNRDVRVAAIRDISELKKTIKELDTYKNKLEEIVKQRTEELSIKNDKLLFEKNQLRTIIDNIPDIIYIKDNESKFLNANKKLLQTLKQEKLNDILGKTDFDFFTDNLAHDYFMDEQYLLKTGNSIIDKEELSINETDKTIYLSTTKVPLKDKSGSIIGFVGIGKDITERKIAENKLKIQAKNLEESNSLLTQRANKIENLNLELIEFNNKLEFANTVLQERKEELETTLEQLKNAQSQLIQSEKLASLGTLVAGIAHEINNPVNFIYAGVNSVIRDFEDIEAVLGNIETLGKKTDSIELFLKEFEALQNEYELDIARDAIEHTLQDIKLGANRIKEIVSGLSRFSRTETEEWKMANLHEELDSVLILLKNKYKHTIQLIKNYDENLPKIECYPGKLNQVFMNIINNAIDAINNKQGKITITSTGDDKNVKISIKDTGKGISTEEISKIFDPFYTTKEVGRGLGLGLAISYTIIQEHNGTIDVDSQINKGTEFIINLPISQKTNKPIQ